MPLLLGVFGCESGRPTTTTTPPPPRVASTPDARSVAPPSQLPLQLRLVARRSVYQLGPEVALLKKEIVRQQKLERERKAASPKSVTERLKEQLEGIGGDRYPEPPAVDLVLEIANVSQQVVEFWSSGEINLALQGPGVITARPRQLHTTEFRLPQATRLGPGEIHRHPIRRLVYGFRGVAERVYWTLPGRYILTASFRTGIYPPPKGAPLLEAPEGGAYGQVVLFAPPVTIEVEASRARRR